MNSNDPVSEENPSKQKLYYTFATPASTLPLNADQRFFYLAEQPQLLGVYRGSTVNPVFNLQPMPVVLSRSNVAQPDESVAQPSKVVSENVQKFSQIPPVMATSVEPVSSQVQGKSAVSENVPVSSVVEHVDAVKHHNVDANQEGHLVGVKQYVASNVDNVEPVAENRVNPAPPVVAVEDNRAIPVSTESNDQVKSGAVIETRSNPVPIVVSNEAVVAPIVSPPTDLRVEGKDSVHSAEVGTVLKELQSVNIVPHSDPVVPAVHGVVPQHGDKVEQDAKHV